MARRAMLTATQVVRIMRVEPGMSEREPMTNASAQLTEAAGAVVMQHGLPQAFVCHVAKIIAASVQYVVMPSLPPQP